MRLPRPTILLSVVCAVVVVIGLFAALLLPRIVDSQMVRERISAELAKRFAGDLIIGNIAVLWLPRPSVVIENAELSFDDQNQGSIGAVRIYPSIAYLLTGQLVVHRVLLEQPKIRIRPPANSEEPFDLEELEKQIRSVLVRFVKEIPAPRIDLSDGSAEIRIGDKPPVILENVVAQTVASPAELRFELSARSSLCERLRVEGRLSPESLASGLVIGVQRLRLKDSLALLPLQLVEYMAQGEVSVEVKIASVGLREVKASIDGSTGPIVFDLRQVKALIDGFAGPIVFTRHDGTATFEAKRLKGGITYEAGTFQVDLEQLDLGSPRLRASGQLKSDSGSIAASVKVRDVDIAEVGGLALQTVGDSEGAKRILRYIPAGTIPEMTIQSAGRSFAEMASSKNIAISGLMRNCKIFIPGPDLVLMNVSGSVRVANNTLEAKDITANLGTMKGWNGTLRLGFEKKTAPFHLDVLVHTGAPELQTVLLKLALDKALRAELLKVRNVEGELSGRLILGETINAISPVVAVSKADISGHYEPIPFPITIRGGRLNYDQQLIRLENAQGSVGRSTFGGLGVTLRHDGSRQIKVDSGRVSLDLRQTDTLLRGFKDWRSDFEKLQSMSGQVELEKLTLTGAYDDPSEWIFASAGRFDRVEITHTDFPGRIHLSHGKFNANQGRVVFSDTTAAMSDASLIAGGTFEYKQGVPIRFETSGTGTVGGQMTQWISRQVELPEEFNLRSPLEITSAHLAWRAGGDISFRGQVTVAGGPQLFLDAVKKPQGLALPNLTVDDGGRRARMTLQLGKHNVDLSFSGELTQETIDRVFVSFPMQGSSLRGDLQVSAVLADPIRFSARGQLSGSNLLVPVRTDKALIEEFSIEAGEESVVIRSADLRWGESHLMASGKITGAKEILRMNLDVAGDQLDWEQLQRLFGGEGKQPEQKKGGVMSIPDVEGTIRLKAGRFTFGRFNVGGLETTAAISPSGIGTEINRGVVCGINTTGRVDVADKDIRLDLQLSVEDAQLEPATVCLTNRQTQVKGTYSLTARITGRGDREHLRSALKGNFDFSARQGEFIRSPGIDATFDYLNATGDFKVAFPNLDRETFPYRVIGAKGRIEGTMLIADEFNVESTLLNLSGQGKVDLELKQIDGKGLVAVLKPVPDVITRIPAISSTLGGSLVGIPVRVTGSLERPEVAYLSPADVGAELLNIPLRILGMPLGAMRLFTPSGETRDKDITK